MKNWEVVYKWITVGVALPLFILFIIDVGRGLEVVWLPRFISSLTIIVVALDSRSDSPGFASKMSEIDRKISSIKVRLQKLDEINSK